MFPATPFTVWAMRSASSQFPPSIAAEICEPASHCFCRKLCEQVPVKPPVSGDALEAAGDIYARNFGENHVVDSLRRSRSRLDNLSFRGLHPPDQRGKKRIGINGLC